METTMTDKQYRVTRWCCTSGMCIECHGMGDKAKRKRVVQSDGLTSAMALKTFNGWNRWGFEPRIEEISMPWCDRCQCWHHATADHIGGNNG